jgi:hypothetical protein
VLEAEMNARLSIAPQRDQVLAGGCLHVVVTLTHEGPLALQAPADDEARALTYVLEPVADPSRSIVLSQERADGLRSDATGATRALRIDPLPGGMSRTYVADLAGLAVEPVAPGRYLLFAMMDLDGGFVATSKLLVTVVAPRVSDLAVAAGPVMGVLALAAALPRGAGTTTVLQRDSAIGAAGDGILYERAELAATATEVRVAVAVELYANFRVRWMAWMVRGELFAVLAEGSTVFHRTGPIALGLAAPMLHPIGWQPADNEASFAALGADAAGVVTVAIVTCSPFSEPRVRSFPLAAAAMPGRWAARRGADDSGDLVDVVTVHADDGVTRVLCQRVRLDPADGSPARVGETVPVLVAMALEPLVAMALAPVAGVHEGVVDLLFGPVGPERRMRLLRCPLYGSTAPVAWTVTVAADSVPSAWSLAAAACDTPVVLARLGSDISAWHAATHPGWSRVASGAGDVDHLHLVALGGVHWAIWADPVEGLQYARVTPPRD